MRLSGVKAQAFFAKPDPKMQVILIYGADAMRVSFHRQSLCPKLIGPDGARDMRLERISAADLRKTPALLQDALMARGFFAGPRLVVLDDATDGLSTIIETAIMDLQPEDATLLITAASLNKRSKLRNLIEKHQNGVAIGLYDDPPNPNQLLAQAQAAGIKIVDGNAKAALLAVAQSMGPSDFDQFLQKLALYKYDNSTPLSPDDIAQVAPNITDVPLDDALGLIAQGQADQIGQLLHRLFGLGQNPQSMIIAAQRHFSVLHMAACDPDGPDRALMRARPPVFGARKDRMVRQARQWGSKRLELVLQLLLSTDRNLRRSHQGPEAAIVERTFIRIAMMCPK